MSLLTFITLAVIAYGVLGRNGYGWALALGGTTAAGSALLVGTTSLPTFFAVAMGAAVALAWRVLRRAPSTDGSRERLPPGAAVLVAFLGWSVLVTLLAPLLFDGQAVVSPVSQRLMAGTVTSSNLAQLVYLVLGVCVMIFVARSPHSRPQLIGLAAGTATVLSFWRYLGLNAGLPFPEGLFDNSPSFAYIETAAGGLERFRGILSEPSGLAGTSLITLAYLLPRSLQLSGWRRVVALAVAGAALYMGLISTSGTFVVAGLISAGVMAATALLSFLSNRGLLSPVHAVLLGSAALVAFALVQVAVSFVGTVIDDKVSSSSFTDRSSANSDSFLVLLDTYGFGVGVGSARASSFLPTLLSATGFIGAALFFIAVISLIVQTADLREYRPVVWALVTLMVTKLIAGPDLSDSTGILWLSLGLLSRGVLEKRRTRASGGTGQDVVPRRPAAVTS